MRALVLALRDVIHGLLGFPAHRGATPACIEERYRNPRRCC